jgi:hypothetical protein
MNVCQEISIICVGDEILFLESIVSTSKETDSKQGKQPHRNVRILHDY